MTDDIHVLATFRAHNARRSQETFNRAVVVLNNDGIGKLGDDGWIFLEQLALASVDLGRLDIADRCLLLLADKFPDSTRIDCLQGIRMEATEPSDTVLTYYEGLLQDDPANAAIWKRKISVLRRAGAVDKAIDSLRDFLDTFYTDVEAWLELADMYASCNQYTSSLQSLTHALLLNPQNPYHVLQAAETAYTADDIPLAIRMFLLVTEMTDCDEPTAVPVGIAVRAWLGVVLCARHLSNGIGKKSPCPSSSQTTAPTAPKMLLLRQLAVERLKSAYSNGVAGREVLAWLDEKGDLSPADPSRSTGSE